MSRCVQSREKVLVRGVVKFVPAVAYHFCLYLPTTFSQPRTKTFSQLCTKGVVTNCMCHCHVISLALSLMPTLQMEGKDSHAMSA